MFNNPELRRQMWIELTPNRLVMMPLTLGAIFFLSYFAEEPMRMLTTLSLIAFGIIVLLWGTKLAFESVISEVNEKTWHSQRMTPISPLDMIIGKLFGSTIYTWYGAAISSATALISIIYLDDIESFKIFLILLFLGLLIHSFSFLSSLVVIRRNNGREKISYNGGIFIIAGVLIPWLMGAIPSMIFGYRSGHAEIGWYSLDFLPEDFMIFALIFFLIWSYIGAYRNMKTEFQMANGPFVWTGFMISLMLFLSGLIADNMNDDLYARILSCCYLSYFIAIAAAYMMAFSEPKDIVEFRRMINLMKHRQWKAFGEAIPLWLISLGFCLMLCLILLIATPFYSPLDRVIKSKQLPVLYPLNCLFFVIRDLSLLIYVNLKGESQRRADLATLVYLMIIYGLIPAIIGLAGFEELVPVFLPLPDAGIINGTMPIMIQSGAMAWLMCRRWAVNNNQAFKGQAFL
ncbi:MAG: hypothetical protein BWK80_12040 [Desulfobacteraceae bacterium IS3]|nr:MAG: hypothetical protein BWK80_12040 [Desulfobacteraceae bacterium IS3]